MAFLIGFSKDGDAPGEPAPNEVTPVQSVDQASSDLYDNRVLVREWTHMKWVGANQVPAP